MTQETIYQRLIDQLLPTLIQYLRKLKDHPATREQLFFHNKLFIEGNELDLMTKLRSVESSDVIDEVSKSVLLIHVCFSTLKLYNRICVDCSSNLQIDKIRDYTDTLKDFLCENPLPTNQCTIPIGFEAEILCLLKNFVLLKE